MKLIIQVTLGVIAVLVLLLVASALLSRVWGAAECVNGHVQECRPKLDRQGRL